MELSNVQKSNLVIVQGDAFDLIVTISVDESFVISSAEFLFADKFRKTYNVTGGDNTVTKTDNKFTVPLTQEDTFSLNNGLANMQIRIKDSTNGVTGTNFIQFKVISMSSKAEVI